MLVLHDDGRREYAYGPALGLRDTKVGVFTQALYDEAIKQGWFEISMKNDWNSIFAFENSLRDRHSWGFALPSSRLALFCPHTYLIV